MLKFKSDETQYFDRVLLHMISSAEMDFGEAR
jgi:hypothetical protein